jgi:hypothetical protein
MLHIPLDTIRIIPACYRDWQLLRAASKYLYEIGDYHKYREYFFTRDGQLINYKQFIEELLYIFRSPKTYHSRLKLSGKDKQIVIDSYATIKVIQYRGLHCAAHQPELIIYINNIQICNIGTINDILRDFLPDFARECKVIYAQ